MRLFLDCEFTQLSSAAKLISLALVSENGRGFYVELLDGWREDDCSDFVNEIVLPQLWRGDHAKSIIEARKALLQFLATFDEELEVATDAPIYDWELFCELAYDNGRWPRNVRNYPTDATTLSPTSDAAAAAPPRPARRQDNCWNVHAMMCRRSRPITRMHIADPSASAPYLYCCKDWCSPDRNWKSASGRLQNLVQTDTDDVNRSIPVLYRPYAHQQAPSGGFPLVSGQQDWLGNGSTLPRPEISLRL